MVVLVDDGKKTDVTKEQEMILYRYGFRYINENWRLALTHGAKEYDSRDGFDEKKDIAMTFDIPCNEQDVMDFLFENKIPFVESEEYDTRTVHYDGKHDYYDTYVNAGNRFLIYGMHDPVLDEIDNERLATSKPFYRTRISDDNDITENLSKGLENNEN